MSTQVGVTPVQDLNYHWRSDGLLGTREQSGESEVFVYHATGRLEQANFESGARILEFGYDTGGLGNLKNKSSSVNTDVDVLNYEYQETGFAGPHGVTSATVANDLTTLVYDAAGNVESITSMGGNTRSFSYDARNLVTGIQAGNPLIADERFSYTPTGARYLNESRWTSTVMGLQSTFTLYDGGFHRTLNHPDNDVERVDRIDLSESVRLIEETNPLGVQTRRLEYVHRDHLGSVDKVTDATGQVVNDLAFDPFGGRRTPTWTSGMSANEVGEPELLVGEIMNGFSDHEHLDLVGVIHMNGRIYEPELGRFLNADPYVIHPGRAASYNRYSYVSNSPLSYVDPDGYTTRPLIDDTPEDGILVDVTFGEPRWDAGRYNERASEADIAEASVRLGQHKANLGVIGGRVAQESSLISGSIRWSAGLQAGFGAGVSKIGRVNLQVAAIRGVPTAIGQMPANGNHLEQGFDLGLEVLGADVNIVSLQRESLDSIIWGPANLNPPSVEGVLFDGQDVRITFDAAATIGIHVDLNLTQTGRNIGRTMALEMYRILGSDM